MIQECILEEVPDEEEAPAPTKSSKDKKANGPDVAKAPNLVFKITSRVPYKTVLKGTLTSPQSFAPMVFIFFNFEMLRRKYIIGCSTQRCCLEG